MTTFGSYCRPFCLLTWRALATALLLLIPAATATVGAESAQQSTVSDSVKSDAARPAADNAGQAPSRRDQAPSATQMQPDSQARPKSLTDKAIEKVKQVAKTASDIFSRVPCLPPKGGATNAWLAAACRGQARRRRTGRDRRFRIVLHRRVTARSAPEFTYPNRLAAQLHRKYPTADITVINRGHGGDDAREMMKRLQNEVIDMHPDLVIWQVGTNAVIRDLDPDATVQLVQDGVARIQAAGADVVLVDPQYSPRMTEHRGKRQQDGQAAQPGSPASPYRRVPALRGDAGVAREAGAADRQFRDRRRPAHERLGLCLLRAIARRRHHQARSARSSSASTCPNVRTYRPM